MDRVIRGDAGPRLPPLVQQAGPPDAGKQGGSSAWLEREGVVQRGVVTDRALLRREGGSVPAPVVGRDGDRR
jgi:hypothetical protein